MCGITPVTVVPMAIVSPDSYEQTKKFPYVIDEAVPRTRPPQEVMNEVQRQRLVDNAKNKPDNERTVMDYFILFQDALSNMKPPVMY